MALLIPGIFGIEFKLGTFFSTHRQLRVAGGYRGGEHSTWE